MKSMTVRQALPGYLDHARSLNLADSYIRIQGSYLRRFADTCDDMAEELGHRKPLMVEFLTPQIVSRYFNGLTKTQASHNRALTALKSYFRYLERMKYLPPAGADWLTGDRKAKKFTRQPKYYIPVSQFGPMIVAAGEGRHPVDRITLALALYTLGRQGEIAGLRLKDVDLDNRTIRLFRPKRKRWTTVQVCPELWDELWPWLCRYRDAVNLPTVTSMFANHPDWYLVPRLDCIRQRGGAGYYEADKTEYRLNPELPQLRLEKLVKRMLDIFGAQTEDGKWVRHKGEGMHTIRRSGARAMIDYLAGTYGEDKALLMVSTMLDHETTTMTLLYIGRSLEQKRLNAYLATGSMYGDHGRQESLPSNVVRMPLAGVSAMPGAPNTANPNPSTQGEVDAL